MNRKWSYLLLSIFFLAAAAGCSSASGEDKPVAEEAELTVSAAASLQDALSEITESFEEEHPEIKVQINYGGSGSLQQQISQGAPVDLFFSAAQDKFDVLVEEGLIAEEDGTQLLANEIVLVTSKENSKGIKSFSDLESAEKISIGTPESVPAGKYGKEALENLKLWNTLEDRVVYAKDVRQVLTYVETGNVDAGIVYKTDALVSDQIEIVDQAGEGSHSPIVYPVGVLKESSEREAAELFYDYLQNVDSMKTFEKFGFKGLN